MQFIFNRIMWGLVSLLVASILIFTTTSVLPGDAADYLLSPLATIEQKQILRKKLALDKPLVDQYFTWLKNILSGDLGKSYKSQKPVAPLLTKRLMNSLLLAIPSITIGSGLAIVLGTLSAYYQGSFFDKMTSFSTLFGLSIPEFIIGISLIWFFSLVLNLTPATSIGTSIFSLDKLFLPILTIIIVMQAHVSRTTKTSVLKELKSQYILAAKARGISTAKILLHALKNALLPTIGVISLEIGWVLGDLVIVEKVFAYPGMGQLLFNSIIHRDIPVIQATVLTITALYLLVSLLIDFSHLYFNPKKTYQKI